MAGRGHTLGLAACAAFALAERLGGVAAAMAWRTKLFTYGLVLLLAFALAHRVLRVHVRRSTQAAAFERIVRAVTDDPRPLELGKGGAIGVLDAADSVSRIVPDAAIPFVADVVATISGLAALVRLSGVPVLAGAALALMLLVATMSVLSRSSDPTFERYLGVAERVADSIDGRTEVLASGDGERFVEETRRAIDDWTRAARSSIFRTLRATRWSVALVSGGILAVLLSHGLQSAVFKQAILAAVLAPLALGAVQSAFAMSKLGSQIAPLQPLFSGTSEPRRGGTVPTASSIRWERATIAYGTRVVVSEATWCTRSGEIVALIGPNGAGKTSLLLATLGLLPLRSGQILMGDDNLMDCDANAWRTRLLYLPQKPYLLPRRTVRAALQFPAHPLGRDAMETVLRRVSLWDRLQSTSSDPLEASTDALSAGERQRLAMARILARRADVYLFDEPDANLDTDGARMVAAILRELASRGAIVIFAAHSPEIVADADHVLSLAGGRLVRCPTARLDAPP